MLLLKRRLKKLGRNRCVIFLLFFLFSYLAFIFTLGLLKKIMESETVSQRNAGHHSRSPLQLPYVIVHIDMKGTPIKLSYLESLLPTLKNLGVNGLLMEYEDMFPYENELVHLGASNKYYKMQLTNFLTTANDMGFEIIPLVQTFGHMEFVLKLPIYSELREWRTNSASICPSKNESIQLINKMLIQMINFHSKIAPLKHIHIGCDEVFVLGKCKACTQRKVSMVELYLSHVAKVAKMVKVLSPNTTVLIWDDMLRGIPPNNWTAKLYVDRLVEPVYWQYTPNIKIRHSSLLEYHKRFDNIWIATAFKGADGLAATLTNLTTRYWNHFNWMTAIKKYKFGGEDKRFTFKGIILTGWSRYSHVESPCELLPVAIPSLFINLLVIDTFRKGLSHFETDDSKYYEYEKNIINKAMGLLACNSRSKIDLEKYINNLPCLYDGSSLYNTLVEIKKTNLEIESFFFGEENGGLIIIKYLKMGKINMHRFDKRLRWGVSTLDWIIYAENKLKHYVTTYYDEEYAKEYVDATISHTKTMVESLLNSLNDYAKALI